MVLERVELRPVSKRFSQPDPLPEIPGARWITEFRTLLISPRNMAHNIPKGSDTAWGNQTR